jgi:hypothetical protein
MDLTRHFVQTDAVTLDVTSGSLINFIFCNLWEKHDDFTNFFGESN